MASYMELYNIVLEKKSRTEYAKEKFKKKYNYDKKTGTIEVDGKRYGVDIGNSKNIDMKTLDGGEAKAPRQTRADILGSVPKVIIGNEYWKTKGGKRRDAILQHEIGHLNMHSVNSKNKHLQPQFISRKVIDTCVNGDLSQFRSLLSAEDLKTAEKMLYDVYLKEYKDKPLSELQRNHKKIRESIFNRLLKKYDNSKENPHINPMEFEADRYAANRSGAKHLKRGVRDISNVMKKENNKAVSKAVNGMEYTSGKNKKLIGKQSRAAFNKSIQADLKARGKALKDSEMRKTPIYKKIEESYANGDISIDEMNILLEMTDYAAPTSTEYYEDLITESYINGDINEDEMYSLFERVYNNCEVDESDFDDEYM